MNTIFIISAPSGAGKTTISNTLINTIKDLGILVSTTTRKKRNNEVDGRDYNFISKKEFQNKMKNNGFIECAQVHGNYYGISKDSVYNATQNNKYVLSCIDWQGMKALINWEKNEYSKVNSKPNIVTVFLLPPSIKELKKRLLKRINATLEIDEEIVSRIMAIDLELDHCYSYDYILINDNIDQTVQTLKELVEHYKTSRVGAFKTEENLKTESGSILCAFIEALKEEIKQFKDLKNIR